jgi:16S rRNA (uracil1498-N3)-methyltransferase
LENIENEICFLSENDSRHAIKVLRLKKNHRIAIVNGKGIIGKAEIFDAHPKKTKIKIIELEKKSNPLLLALAFCPTKSNERNSFIIEKSTEIGVTDFYPIISQNSERRIWNISKFEKNLIATLKQSQRFWIPTIHKIQNFNDFIKNQDLPILKFLAHCKQSSKQKLSLLVNHKKPQIIVIGPEGDFTNQEINDSLKHGFKMVELGKNRLRTETACLVSVTLMKF